METNLTGPLPGSAPVVIPFADVAALLAFQRDAIKQHAAHQPLITSIFPVARRITIGGRTLKATELRLADMAELQGWIEEDDHPLAGYDPAAPEADRLQRLRAAWSAAATWPPRIGTPEGWNRIGTLGGRALLLRLATQRHQPDLTDEDLAGIVASATPVEWSALGRIMWGVTPRVEIANLVAPDAAPGPGIDWRLAICRTVENHNWTFREVGELTVNQWAALATGGKPQGSAGNDARMRRVRDLMDSGERPSAG